MPTIPGKLVSFISKSLIGDAHMLIYDNGIINIVNNHAFKKKGSWLIIGLSVETVATPKQIRELMKVDGLTNDEVKSHLQVNTPTL